MSRSRLIDSLLPLPTIRNKLVALSFSFLLVSVGLVFLLVYTQQRQLLQTQLAESMAAQASLLATNLQAAAAFVDRREADRLLSSLAINPAVDAGRAVLANGTILAAYQRIPLGAPDIPDGMESLLFTADHLLVRQPIMLPDQATPAGRIELLVSLEPFHATMRRTMSDTLTLLLAALAVLLVFSRFVVARITAPLEYLAQLVNRVSHHARLDERLKIDSHDEIGSLSHGFNRMLDTLQARDRELGNYRDRLESMVAERTAALHEAIGEARQANRAKSDFLARMSHEIRTPLNAITGLSRIVLETPLNAQQREYLDQVVQSSDALLGIINDILDYSKIEAGGLRLENSPFELDKLFQSVGSLFAARVRAQGLELRFAKDDGVPPVVLGDALRLGQILINLVGNAAKFTPGGEIEVRVGVAERLPEQRIRLAFSVRDTGIGIASEHQDGLFSPFTQADSSITRRFGGTGLGLAICRQLVELMDGEITLASAPGQGSTFRFTVLLTEAPAAAADAAVISASPVNDAVLPRWAGERVLVVEDIAINRTIAIALLQRVGLSVAVAANGQEALDQLAREPFALVLMDIQMPVMDGLTATRMLRADPRWRTLPVIAMTAHATSEDQQQTAAAGMNAHLTKPILPKVLYATLSQWLPPIASGLPVATEEVGRGPVPALDDWPALPGIDRQAGLELHMNRPEFYLKSLHAFRQDFAGSDDRINAALTAGERIEARRLAHSVKSVAASLGAGALSDCARRCEQTLAADGTTNGLAAALADFGRELAMVIDGLGALPPLISTPARAVPFAWPAIDAAFARLEIRLSMADARSEAGFAEIRRMLAGQPAINDECRTMLTEIAALIDDVEYESAREKLRALRAALAEQPA